MCGGPEVLEMLWFGSGAVFSVEKLFFTGCPHWSVFGLDMCDFLSNHRGSLWAPVCMVV